MSNDNKVETAIAELIVGLATLLRRANAAFADTQHLLWLLESFIGYYVVLGYLCGLISI